MRFIRHRMHTRRIDPPVVEVEEGANRDSKVEFLVCPLGGARLFEIIGTNTRRVAVDLVEQPEESLVTVVERRRLNVTKDGVDEFSVTKQYRRNCGVRLDSKRTTIALRGVRGDQLTKTWAERRWATKNLLRESSKMISGGRQKGK
jgi:hypothetical protein